MANPGTKAIQQEVIKEERRTRVAALLIQLERPSVRRIASVVGASRSTIHRDIKAIREEWKKARLKDTESQREIELAKINLVEQEAWTALRQSGQTKVKTTEKRKVIERSMPGKKKGEVVTFKPTEVTETSTTEEDQVMAARYMNVIAQCGRDRRALLGLDKAPSFIKFTEHPVTLVIGDEEPDETGPKRAHDYLEGGDEDSSAKV